MRNRSSRVALFSALALAATHPFLWLSIAQADEDNASQASRTAPGLGKLGSSVSPPSTSLTLSATHPISRPAKAAAPAQRLPQGSQLPLQPPSIVLPALRPNETAAPGQDAYWGQVSVSPPQFDNRLPVRVPLVSTAPFSAENASLEITPADDSAALSTETAPLATSTGAIAPASVLVPTDAPAPGAHRSGAAQPSQEPVGSPTSPAAVQLAVPPSAALPPEQESRSNHADRVSPRSVVESIANLAAGDETRTPPQPPEMTAEGMPFGESISASPAANDQTPPPGTPALANAGPAEIAAAPFSEADTAESPDPAQIAVNAAPETEVVANPDLAATANPAPEVETAANADPENAKIMDRFPEAPTPSAPYQVQPGDTLEAVAMALAVPLAALIQANHIQDPNLILAGTELIIPVMPAAAATENAGPDGEPQQPPTATMPGNSLPLQDLQATASRPIDAVTLLTQLQASQPHPAATENPYLARLLEEIEAAQTAHQSRPATQSPIPETTVRAASTPTRAASRRVRRSTPRVTTARAAAGKRAPAASGTWNNRRVEASAPIPFGPGAYPELSAEFKGFVWPSPGVLTSGFGWRWGRMHRGVDIAAPSGTPVVAAAPGVVEFAGWNDGGYGNMVDIRHPDGSLTRYAHNSRLLVRAGQTVLQGQLVSEVGSTGYSTGPHLHFEIHQPTGGAVNPIALLPEEPKL